MPARRSEKLTQIVVITANFLGDDLNIVCTPGKIGTKQVIRFDRRLEEAKSDEQKALAIAERIAAIAESWDYLDDNGDPLPVTLEYLTELPSFVLLQFVEQIGKLREHLGDPKETRTPSIVLSSDKNAKTESPSGTES
jgi:hypothetical protein